MKRKEWFVMCAVAVLTAWAGSWALSPLLIAKDRVPPGRQGSVTIESVKMKARLASAPAIGEEPVLLLDVENTLASPVSFPLTLSLSKNNPLAAMSRAMPMRPVAPAWSDSRMLNLKANQKRTIRVPMPHAVQAHNGLGTLYTVYAKKTEKTIARPVSLMTPKIRIQSTVQLRQITLHTMFADPGQAIASFSIQPEGLSLAKAAK